MISIGDKVVWKHTPDTQNVVTNIAFGYAEDGIATIEGYTAKEDEAYLLCDIGTEYWVPAHEVQVVGESDAFYDQDIQSPQLQELGYRMVSWLDGLPSQPDNSKLYDIATLLLAVQYDKENHYGSSWKGKGEYRGIMANIDRKYDRLDRMTQDEINGTRRPLPTASYEELTGKDVSDVGESKIDAVADLANYCLLYLSYMREHYPGAFRIWIARNIPGYLRDKLTFL